jgi:tetratricopeptide (TPR) repeat protein
MALLFILPLTLWAYLPLRANQDLSLNCDWGNPKTLERLIAHLSVKEYHYFMVFSAKECLNHLFLNLKTVFVSEYGFLIFFSICGFFALLKNKSTFSLFLLLVGLANIFHLTTYAIPISNTRDYHLPSCIILSFWMGQAMFSISSFVKRFSLLLLFIPLFLFASHHQEANKARYYFAYDNGRNMLKPLRDNALLFTYTDDDIFPLLYLQYCSEFRSDITSINILRLQYDWYAERLKEDCGLSFSLLPQDLSSLKGGEDVTRFRIKDIVDKNIKSCPVYIFPAQFIPDNQSFREGIAYKILEKDMEESEFNAEFAKNELRFLWREFNPDSKGKEMISRYVDVYYSRGLEYGYKGMYEEAALEFKEVIKHSPLHCEAFFNLGVAYSRMGRMREAKTCFKKTLLINPAHQSAQSSLDIIQQNFPNFTKKGRYNLKP